MDTADVLAKLRSSGFKFFLDSGITFAGIGAMTFFAYLYHFLMVRVLSVPDYGELSVLIAVFAILTFPATSVQSYLSVEVLRLNREKKEGEINYFVMRSLLQFFLAGAVLLLICAAAALFNPSSPAPAIMLLGTVFIYFIAIPGAYFQGKENVLVASFIQAFIAVLKIAIAALLVYAGFGFFGAVLSFLLSAAIAFAVLILPLLSSRKMQKYDCKTAGSVNIVLLTGILFTIFIYLDLFAVRLFLGAADAGIYNTATITARIIYFLSTGLVLVFMPQSAKIAWERIGKKHAILLAKSALLLLAPTLFFAALPQQLIGFFYTSAFISASQPFLILSLAMFFFSVFFLVCNMFWSRKEEKIPFFLSVSAILLQACVLYFFAVPQGTLSAFAQATLISSVLLAAAGVIFFFFSRRYLRPESRYLQTRPFARTP